MNETSVMIIIIAAIFTNNILLSNFLGMCSFIACSGQISTALGLGTAVTFVMTCTTVINYFIYHSILVVYGLAHLKFIIFIAVIAALQSRPAPRAAEANPRTSPRPAARAARHALRPARGTCRLSGSSVTARGGRPWRSQASGC